MATLTPNYNFIKPAPGNPIDQDIWGGQLNSNWQSLDSLLKVSTDFTAAATETAVNVPITSLNQNQLVPLDATSNNITVDLPAAATVGNGFVVGFKRIDSSSNTVTIDPNLAETIDGSATFPLNIQNRGIIIVSDGTNWLIKAWYSPKITASEIDAETSTDGQILTSDGAGNVAFEDPATVTASDIDSTGAGSGDVLTADGIGGAAFQSLITAPGVITFGTTSASINPSPPISYGYTYSSPPTIIVSSGEQPPGIPNAIKVDSRTVSSFTVRYAVATTYTINWIAIGN